MNQLSVLLSPRAKTDNDSWDNSKYALQLAENCPALFLVIKNHVERGAFSSARALDLLTQERRAIVFELVHSDRAQCATIVKALEMLDAECLHDLGLLESFLWGLDELYSAPKIVGR